MKETRRVTADDGRVLTEWDPAEHPYWPPVDENGKLIGDVPWKFFDPEKPSAAGCRSATCRG